LVIQKLSVLFVTVLLAVSYIAVFATSTATAAAAKPAPKATTTACPDGSAPPCGTGIISDKAAKGNCVGSLTNCDIFNQYVNPFINFLAALVGVAVVISIIYGGIQYGSSAGDPQKITAAKTRIRNALIALVTFMFLFSLLKFLLPGGLF